MYAIFDHFNISLNLELTLFKDSENYEFHTLTSKFIQL